MQQDSAAGQLGEALDQMRDAVLRGDLSQISHLGNQIDDALAALPPLRDQRLAQGLHHKAERNAQLLQAAGRGLRAAQRRLAEIRSARDSLVTYDVAGKRNDLPQPRYEPTRRV